MRAKRAVTAVSAVAMAMGVAVTAARAGVTASPAPSRLPQTLAGDFSGDGRPDIALVGASGWTGTAVATQTAAGDFTALYAVSKEFAANASLPGVKIVTGRFNGDTADDILLTGVPGWTTMPVALSNKNGTFTVSNVTAGAFGAWAALAGARVLSGDFNHDGRTDLALTGDGSSNTIPVAFSAGNGTFTLTDSIVADFPESGDDARVFSGDFDGDGRTDLALLPGGDQLLTDSSLHLALSKGDGTFHNVSTDLPDFVDQTDHHKAVFSGDFNGDGRTDLTVVLPDRILVAYSHATGTFDLYRAGATPAFHARADQPGANIVAADYDCDGRTDLAVLPGAGTSETTIPVAMPRDAETFFVMNDPVPPDFAQLAGAAGATVTAADFDSDGCQDLALTGGAGWTSIAIAVSNGDGSFNERKVSSPAFAGWAAGVSPVTLPPPPPEIIGTMSILDTDVVSGIESSMAIGSDGLGIVSYYQGGNAAGQNLRVAHCLDEACTAVTATDLDTVGDVGRFSSIKVGRDGLPLISYITFRSAAPVVFTEDLKVAHCNDLACTSATITTLDAASRVDDVTALTIGGDGLGLISYQDTRFSSATRMKVAHCGNTACTSATLNTIDTVGSDNGESGGYQQTGIATGNHGLGLVSYYSGTGQSLKVAACTTPDCSATVITTVDKAADPLHSIHGGWSSVTFGSDGLALISYHGDYTSSGSHLKVAHCLNVYCTESTVITADTGGHVGAHTSIGVGGDGLGVISYYDSTNRDLKVAHCANLSCSAATATTVDSFDDVGFRSSITVGPDGRPMISYEGPGFTSVALRVVRCGNADCTAVITAPF